LPGWRQSESVAVTTPGGSRLTPLVRAAGEDRGLLNFEAVETGVYQVERPSGRFSFVVQPGRDDSVLAAMDAATLRQWWAPARCEVIRAGDLEKHLDVTEGRHKLWPWLLLAAGLVLLAEMWLVHRLCPRASPK